MKIAGIIDSSVVNGEGMRTVIFTTGCNHNCKGCHNKELQDPHCGKEMCYRELTDIVKTNLPLIDGVTISGGDPFHKSTELREFLRDLRGEIPGINVWVYTGYTYEELIEMKQQLTLELIDVLIDGKFDIDKLTTDIKYIGSTNQRILKLINGVPVE